MKAHHILLVLLTTCVCLAQGTNTYITKYQDLEDYGSGNWSSHETPSERYAIEPAEVESNDIWSDPVDGCSVSLRFRTNAYTFGKPVLGYLYLRNTTNQNVYYPIIMRQGRHSAIADFDIVDSNNNKPKVLPQISIMPKTGQWVLEPRQQQRFLVRFDKIFELAPGTYKIRTKAHIAANRVVYSDVKEINILPDRPQNNVKP